MTRHKHNKTLIAPLGMVGLTILTGAFLMPNTVNADNTDIVDQINITVPVSCTMSGTGMDTHNAQLHNGQHNSNIGETTLNALCNDNEGFAIYAIGYTDNLNGKNVMTSSALDSSFDIPTGTATSGDNSQWAMKLSTVTSPAPTYPIAIQNSFDSFQLVPDTNTLVAKREAGTDIGTNAEGSTLKATYQAYVSQAQPAGTYTGQVKYTLVHPHNEPTPPDSMLLDGRTVNAKMKSLSTGSSATYSTNNTKIKAIRMADTLPEGFVFTDANTISTANSKYPVYIFFDNTDNKGIMYFYTEGDTVVMNTNSREIFRGFTKLADISDLSYWDSSQVDILRGAFWGDAMLASLHGLENWNTSNVTAIQHAFFGMTSLNDISALSNWDVDNVVSMGSLFAECSSLTSLHSLENWNVSSVETFDYTFYGLSTLTDISAIADWNVSNAKSMTFMFMGNELLSDITPLENWDTRNVTNMGNMFRDLPSLTDVSTLANWDTSNVTAMYYMFEGDTSLTTYDLSHWDTSNVTSMKCMFSKNTSLTTLDLSHFDTSNVKDMSCMLAGNTSLTSLNLSGLNTSSVTSMWDMFHGSNSLTALDLSHFDTSNVTDMRGMFAGATSLTTVNTTGWDTSSVTTMSGMFTVSSSSYVGDGQLREIIGIEDWNISNVIDMTCMFYGAGNMTHYDIANWDVSKVESFNHMFADNFKLESLDLSKWDVSSVKTMYDMFDDNYKLTTIGDVSHWNTASLIDVGGFLNGSSSFVGDNGTLDLSGWNTSNLKAAGEMFRATKLQIIDLSGWDLSSIINGGWDGAGSGIYYEYNNQYSAYKGLGRMFMNTAQLNTVYVSQSGLNSFNTIVNNGINTTDMWTNSGTSGFTVK